MNEKKKKTKKKQSKNLCKLKTEQDDFRPSIIESSFIVILWLQTEMRDAVDIWIISKF